MKNIYTKKMSILGFFFISIVGTLSHFVYEWSQNNSTVGALFAVNESTWEHLKIAIIPAFIWLIITLLIGKERNNFFIANLLSFLTIIISISIILLILLFVSFVVFTYAPPKMEIFRNPVNNGYGITS